VFRVTESVPLLNVADFLRANVLLASVVTFVLSSETEPFTAVYNPVYLNVALTVVFLAGIVNEEPDIALPFTV